ncbi:MAG: hypothetical protein QOH03_778 [Kribbellaceae bacterium]|jgi:transcriptional regulator with XRE-family HTH domain|nr:hypothetical protein [Kribbellaceae bacterium]
MTGADFTNVVKLRRAEMDMTQQEAARRGDVSLATWRRFENSVIGVGTLDSFRKENVKGFARGLGMSVPALERMLAGDEGTGAGGLNRHRGQREDIDDSLRRLNEAFTGDPLTPMDAMALAEVVMFSDFAPVEGGRYTSGAGLDCGFGSYLKGESTIREVVLLGDLPDWVLSQVNDHWLVRMGERMMRIADQLSEECRIPTLQCLADQVAVSLIIGEATPPQLGDLDETSPGLLGAEEIFGHDPDVDDPEDEGAIREEWMNRMHAGLLTRDAGDRRLDELTMTEFYGQSVYDTNSPLHPMRWFDRDDLRKQFEYQMTFHLRPQEEQDRLTEEALNRAFEHLVVPDTDTHEDKADG